MVAYRSSKNQRIRIKRKKISLSQYRKPRRKGHQGGGEKREGEGERVLGGSLSTDPVKTKGGNCVKVNFFRNGSANKESAKMKPAGEKGRPSVVSQNVKGIAC